MASNEKAIFTLSLEAGEDLSSSQYLGVTMSDDRKVDAHDATTDIPIGILLNEPESGQQALVMVVGQCPIIAGESITAGKLIRLGANARAYVFDVDTDVTTYAMGQCTKGAASGEKIDAVVNCCTPTRGEE